jgi:hypothetical protein
VAGGVVAGAAIAQAGALPAFGAAAAADEGTFLGGCLFSGRAAGRAAAAATAG